ncbi:MAG: YeeE/YedE family protein [Betaproteobacteria bacterium]|nr:YeeE/YedE family protein [Betaproteobacteria bacterium]NBY04545.1 YeeE/YedE family protein [Betaproteobacteria bacterium]
MLFGAIAQRTHFCTMGAISDVVNISDWTRLRQWALVVAVATIGFALLSWTGQIDPSQSLYSTQRLLWLSSLVGGALFGLGMVLASGCGNKTLIRMGTGNLKSWVVFVFMGVSAFATLKGVTAVGRNQFLDSVFVEMPSGAHLGAWFSVWLDLPLAQAWPTAGMVVSLVLLAWTFARRDFWQTENLLVGLGLGLLVTAMWWVSGHFGFLAEHPETLEAVYLTTNSGRMEAMSFVAPMAYTLDWLMFFSDKSKVLSFGIVSALGVVCGSAVSSLSNGSFRWEGFSQISDLSHHLLGAVLMGVGGVTAMGCTIGQGVSGLSVLSLNALLAVLGIFAGALAGFRYQTWSLERSI